MAREAQILIRLSEEEKAAFEKAAKVGGLSTSSWIRQKLRTAALEELRALDMQVAFLVPIVSQGIPHEQDNLQLRKAASGVGKLVSGLPCEAHAGMAENTPAESGAENQEQREELREGLCAPGKVAAAAVPMRESKEPDAPPRLHETAGSPVAVPTVPSGAAPEAGGLKWVRPNL
jgi:hypothetical protein